MGTDSITLFNKSVADKLLAMDQVSLTRYLEENIEVLKRRKFRYSPVVLEMNQSGSSVSEAVEVLSKSCTLNALKAALVRDFALGDEEIYLDYWGCYAAVFDGHPDGSISSLTYLPDEIEETFLLLQPNHVGQMIESVYLHLDELRVMDRQKIKRVEEWRDYCIADSSYLVAYLFDF
jgi:hypothetical protein